MKRGVEAMHAEAAMKRGVQEAMHAEAAMHPAFFPYMAPGEILVLFDIVSRC